MAERNNGGEFGPGKPFFKAGESKGDQAAKRTSIIIQQPYTPYTCKLTNNSYIVVYQFHQIPPNECGEGTADGVPSLTVVSFIFTEQ